MVVELSNAILLSEIHFVTRLLASKPAPRTASLQSIRITSQTRVFDTGQLSPACTTSQDSSLNAAPKATYMSWRPKGHSDRSVR